VQRLRWLVRFDRSGAFPRLPSPPAPLPEAGEGRIRSRFGRCGVRDVEAPSGTRQRPESGLSAFPAAGSPAHATGRRCILWLACPSIAVWRIPRRCHPRRTGRLGGAAPRDDRCASAGVACVLVKPRAGRDSGPSRGFPLSQRRVHPLMRQGGGAFCGSRALQLLCGGSLVAAIFGLRAGSVGPLPRDDRCASAGVECVQVKPHAVCEAFRGCCGGFTRSREARQDDRLCAMTEFAGTTSASEVRVRPSHPHRGHQRR